MRMDKKVSVIIPCYNIEKYIDRCLQSLEQQSMPMEEIEIILVDDNSTDGTWGRLQAYEEKYPESVMIIHNDVNIRQGAIRNMALDYASAGYIAFIDGDDWISRDYLSKLYDKAVEYDCDLVMCNAYRDFGDGRRIEIKKTELSVSRFICIDTPEKRKNIIVNETVGSTAWAKLIRKNYLIENEIYFPEGIFFEDIPWGALNNICVSRMYITNEFLYHYFINENSVVLKKDQTYYRDMLEANYYKWSEIERRNVRKDMPLELEFDFIVNYYLAALNMFAHHYTEIPPEVFEEMQQFVMDRFPQYQTNPYIKNNLGEKHQMQIYFLDKKMGKEELRQLHGILSGSGLQDRC